MRYRFLLLFVLALGLFVSQTKAQGELEVTAGEPISDAYTQATQVQNQVYQARVTQILELQVEEYDDSQSIVFQTVELEILKGLRKGEIVTVEFNRALSTGESVLKVGDKVLLNASFDQQGQVAYYIIDFVRHDALLSLLILFILVVLLVGQGKGLASFLGLLSSFVIIFMVILPGIQAGIEPLVVAIGGAVLIIGITFYLSHGINQKTHWAVMGTIVSLVITGFLGLVFVDQARLTGFGAEEANFLQFLKSGELNIRGLLLAGMIIGALGVLDDITISQASIVKELKEANKKLSNQQIFLKAMNVGRDHIASLVNTLILVYTGGSLPLLLLFTFDSSRSFLDVVNYEVVAEELVHTLVASIGLVIAVPITTFLATWFGFKNVDSKNSKSSSGHSHSHL